MCQRPLTREELIEELNALTKMGGEGYSVYVVDNDWPAYAYTVGLTALNHPELVLFGLERWRLLGLLCQFAEGIRDGHVNPLSNGARTRVGDWNFTAKALPNPRRLLPRAHAIYGRRFRALQLIYPDVHGVWPWEDDCHLFPGQQSLPAEHPGYA